MTQGGQGLQNSEAVTRRCSVKKMFLRISQVHRKTLVSESLLCFPVNFAKLLRTHFL